MSLKATNVYNSVVVLLSTARLPLVLHVGERTKSEPDSEFQPSDAVWGSGAPKCGGEGVPLSAK